VLYLLQMVTIADIATALAAERAAALPGREAATVSGLMWQLWDESMGEQHPSIADFVATDTDGGFVNLRTVVLLLPR
jgi:hypothetical protein